MNEIEAKLTELLANVLQLRKLCKDFYDRNNIQNSPDFYDMLIARLVKLASRDIEVWKGR